MTGDATFEEGGEGPLRLKAMDADDLQILSSLAQDAVFDGSEMHWDRRARRFGLLLNRFRWEDAPKAEARRRPYERVRAVLAIEDVTRVRSQGVEPGDAGRVYSLLSVVWEPGADGTGAVVLTLAGDGAIRIEAETLEVMLRDVTRPYRAPSGKKPAHGG
ncbi:MAG: Protein of unknown function (DUF2948) [Rhodobacteraceae bacterium HLUCCA08]|nr:MAG: Protein of unknown function (DUF2948) [Rhodobacteraceae bacterium HLUCCA08]